MADHPNAAIVRAVMNSFDTGDMQALADMLAEDVIWHEIGNPEPVRGKAALAARMSGGTGYQITGKMHDVVANDDHTIVLTSATGTRNGKTLDYRTAEIFHMKDGKITERWAFSDDTAAINEFFG
jgi:ketosteroid isomerase-like protein